MRVFAIAGFLVFLSLVVAVSDAIACTCFAPPTVLEEFDKSPIVMIARLDGFEELDRQVDGTNVYRTYAALMTVEKVYKGGVKEDQTIKVYDGGGGDCSTGFRNDKIGQTFLFYSGGAQKVGNLPGELYLISLCSRSERVEDAKPDLSYLDNRASLEGKTRLSGTIKAWGDNPPSVADLQLTISGERARQVVKTDRSGFFEVWGLPPGHYSVAYQVPDGWKIASYLVIPSEDRRGRRGTPPNNMIQAPVAAGKHTEVNVYLQVDNQISGVVLSPSGTPMKGVCVSAYWLTPTTNSFRIPDDCTNEKGEFSITELSAGNYRLEVNSGGRITSSNPFEKFYYPNALEKENAQVISIGAGVHVRDLVIRVTETLPLITISGKLTFQDGKPFPEEEIRFDPRNDSRFERLEAETDKNGNFSFEIPVGAKGKLSAVTNIYDIRYEDCPQVKELRKTRRGRESSVPSNTITIDGQSSRQDIRLTFPIPFCRPSD